MEIQLEPTGNHGSDREAIMEAFRRIVRELRVFSRAAEKNLGASGAQLFVLQQLGGKGSLSINELAERTLTHQSSVSAVVSRLIGQGLVKRSRSARDRRIIEVDLTPAGRRLLKRSKMTPQERLLQSISRLSASDQRRFAILLERVLDGAAFAVQPKGSFLFEDERSGRIPRRRSQS